MRQLRCQWPVRWTRGKCSLAVRYTSVAASASSIAEHATRHGLGRWALRRSLPSNCRRPPALIARFSSLAIITPYREEQRNPDDSTVLENESSILENDRLRDHLGTFEDWSREADINNENGDTPRLVDQEPFRDDAQVWLTILQFRERIDGSEGVWDTWLGLRKRDLDLPVQGEEAQSLWQIIIATALQTGKIAELYQYARDLQARSGALYHGLYQQIMAYYLEKNTGLVLEWHKKLKSLGLPKPGALEELVVSGLHSQQSLKTFKRLYIMCGDQKISDTMISTMFARQMIQRALAWHRFLAGHGDVPSRPETIRLLERYLNPAKMAAEKAAAKKVANAKSAYDLDVPATIKEKVEFSRESMNKVMGEVHGVTQKQFSDKFCARAFATRAFSIDIVTRGLLSFGLEQIGPLAFREIAARSNGPTEILQNVEKIRELGIRIQNCTFSNVILKLANDGNSATIDSILQSDQHPEVFEDQHLLRRLLQSYLLANDTVQAQRMLVVLSICSPVPVVEAFTDLLHIHIKAKNRQAIKELIGYMLREKIIVKDQSIKKLFHFFVPVRRRTKAPADLSGYQDVVFVTNIWLEILKCGQNVPAAYWRQVGIYYGMLGLLQDLDRLLVWLAIYYTKRQELSAIFTPLDAVTDGTPEDPLTELFRVQLQRALVEWGFKSVVSPMHRSQERLSFLETTKSSGLELSELYRHQGTTAGTDVGWLRGILLLRRLQGLGVKVRKLTIIRALRSRFSILFAPGLSNRRINRTIKKRNAWKLQDMITQINAVWPEPVFDIPAPLLEARDARSTRLLLRHITSVTWGDPVSEREGLRQLEASLAGGERTGVQLGDRGQGTLQLRALSMARLKSGSSATVVEAKETG